MTSLGASANTPMAAPPPDMRDHLGKATFGRTPSRRTLAALLGASAAVLVLALVVDRLLRSPTQRNAAAVQLLFPLAAPGRAALKPGPPADGLPSESDLSFEDLLGYLEEVAQEEAIAPAAKEFVEGFQERPELRRIVQDFKEESAKGKKPSATRFIATLRQEPAFRQLVSKLLSSAQSAAQVSGGSHPELGELVKAYQEARGMAFAPEPGKTPGGRPPSFEEARRLALQSASAGSPGSRKAAASGAGTHAGGAGVPDPRGGAFVSPGGAPVALEGRIGGGQPPPSNPGAPNRLKDVKQITTRVPGAKLLQLYPFLAKHFTPAELGKLEEDVERFGLWGACFENGWFSRCGEACRDGIAADGRRTCTVPDGWAACMKDLKDEGRCIELCMSQAPCVPDRKTVKSHCDDPSRRPPPSYCDPKPEEKPEPDPGVVPVAPSVCAQEPFGLCCFNEWGAMVHAEGRWPAGVRQCAGPFGLKKGVCRRITAGVCCWDEETSKVIYRNHDKACDGAGPVPCEAPICCREMRGERCCFHGKDGTPVEGSPAACREP